ncbi:DUF871 domain-containing protein [Anaerorhabdus sp.]|uniref:DUF871 domain-containing protein n=1 Tax=Anaerorhabdus sp. TaxID=1872524 RepID=UPI002FCA6ECD
MPRLGISLYPDVSNSMEKDKDYIDIASKYGYNRLFTNLLSVNEEDLNKFRELNKYAHEKGFEVILDVAPSVFEANNCSYDDLSFFKNLYADGIRLDEGFNGQKEALMTVNPQRLKIEVNASQDTKYIDNILSYKPYRENLITCHNFYPQRYTGLSYELFTKTSKDIKANNLKVAAFVSSQVAGAFGPWPVNDGLCTLEMHRDLPIDLQVRHYFATGLVDDVLIANCYATEEELKTVSEIHPGKLTIKIELDTQTSDVEKDIIFNYPHYVRGDMSEYMARSTMSRIDYKDAVIKATNTPSMLHRGDICILNENYGRYKGELHLILKDMPNSGNINLVGKVLEEEKILLEFIEPWKPFALIK